MRLTAAVLLATLSVAAAGKWRQSPCVEPADEDGNTCSDYASLEGETTCEELMDLIDGNTFNGETLHCQCACPEWYEPVPEAATGCDEWTVNKRCPESFDRDAFDYHPLGDHDEEACLAVCSNMPGPVCCLLRGDGLCYSHRITSSMELSGRTGARAAICNVGCDAKFDVTLYDSGEDGWSGYFLTLMTSETNVQLSVPITHKVSDVAKSTHKLCVRLDTPCYTVRIAKGGTNGDELDQLAEISYDIEFDGEVVASGTGSEQPSFGLDGKGCPSRLYKRLGRYALKQFEKVSEESLDAAKAYRNIGRKADKLGIFVRPLKKMGAVWPQGADWAPTTTTDPFGIGDTTSTTTTTTEGSDISVVVTGGGACGDFGHCSIDDVDVCEQEAIKWGLSDTAADTVDRPTKPPGCVQLSGGALQFNSAITGNKNSAASSTTLLCKLCTMTSSTVSSSTSSTTADVTTKKETTELVRTTATTTTEAPRVFSTESPYQVIEDGRCWQYGLCRVITSEACDRAAGSLGMVRSGDINRAARPGGCLEWSDGKVKFNTVLESEHSSQLDEAMLICYECDDFKAPAPEFERIVTTDEPTREVITTEEARVVTTEEVETRKITKEATTQRYIDYVTKQAGTERCRPDYCALESKEACEAGAVFTELGDVTAGLENKPLKAAGCYLTESGVLKFNQAFTLSDGSPNLKVGKSTETLVCMTCAPAPAPARAETTEEATREDFSTEQRGDTTEKVRTTTTAPPRNYYYYYASTEQRDTGSAYDVVVDTERPAYYGVETTTQRTTTTTPRGPRTTTTDDSGGGGDRTTEGRTTSANGRTTTDDSGGRTDDSGGRTTTDDSGGRGGDGGGGRSTGAGGGGGRTTGAGGGRTSTAGGGGRVTDAETTDPGRSTTVPPRA